MKQLFLPLGLVSAIIVALFLPAGGIFIADNHGLKILVVIIFIVSGYQTGTRGLLLNRGLLFIFPAAALISLIIAPLLGLCIVKLIDLTLFPAMGLLIISAVPPTLSSGIVITDLSGGNTILALFLTVSLNLLGIFTLPFMLNFCLKAVGPVDVDQNALLLKMLFFVLLPFITGKLIRTLLKVHKISANWSYVNSSCVILMVYASLAVSKNIISDVTAGEYGIIFTAVTLLHILLLLINTGSGKLLRLPLPDQKALLFVASQKTLPISIAVLANITCNTGSAIIVCLMFHFMQLLLDSFLAAFLQKK
ncbi:MAG: bile acid:sodium symporter [Desulfocapsa sp.]|nr:MAG: bile acid:sodium symporter [Desulfocapsa sp.]